MLPVSRIRLVLLGSADRRSLEVQLSPAWIASMVALLLVVLPAAAGATLGAQDRHAVLRRAVHIARLPHTRDALPPPARRTAYRLAALAAPPPQPTLPPAPPPEDLLARELATPEHRRGHLRIHALHHDEYLDVVPHDEQGVRDEQAFAALSHLFRCRVTGHEMPVDERLVRLLTSLNDLYDKPLHLISGHRVAHTIQTSPTSQHTMGTAADVRIPGVSIEELRQVAAQLGARGLGLYTHKRFVHIDFRAKRRYFWTDAPEAEGEDALAAHDEPAPATDERAEREAASEREQHTHDPTARAAEDGHVHVARGFRYEG